MLKKTRQFSLSFIVLSCTVLNALAQQPFYDVTWGNGNGIRLGESYNYKLHMGNSSEYLCGPVSNYGIKMKSHPDGGHGWTWGVNGQTPVAAIGNAGHTELASHFESNGNIVSYRTCSEYFALAGDLLGFADCLYPTFETFFQTVHFRVANKYSAYLTGTNTVVGLLKANIGTDVSLGCRNLLFSSRLCWQMARNIWTQQIIK